MCRLIPSVLLSIIHVVFAHAAQHTFSAPPRVPIDPIAQSILDRALQDGIDLSSFTFTRPALDEIVYWYHFEAPPDLLYSLLEPPKNGTTIDVHAHYAPKWYGTIRQDSTEWTLESQLLHMANQSIAQSIFSIPNPNIFLGDTNATVAIARLLNENMAALVKRFPRRFSFFATIPLPYVDESITEEKYAFGSLGAIGVALTSNHEGRYLGDHLFTPFFAAIEKERAIVFVHPTEPLLEVNQSLIQANPTVYSSIMAEFYFETARTFLDLAFSETLTTFTSLDFIIPHAGGSLPSIIDRSIPAGPTLEAVMDAFSTRCWWDSAGLTYSHQIGGLLAHNISPSFLLYGSDFPYVSPALVDASSKSIANSPFINEEQKGDIKSKNPQRLFASKGKYME
ncbi:hypothetical protein B0H10DRAFT_243828 [Mycena sp. CBHHK59/15]|nr:hypothetical protein B0H10DRAFT_243828 [Mycena sp. CBHHK59/15]